MTRRPVLPGLALLTGTILLATTAGAQQRPPATPVEDAGPSFVFSFAPPPVTFERTVRTVHIREMAGGSMADELERTETVRIETADDGFRKSTAPSAFQAKRNGTPVSNPVLDGIQMLPVHQRISAEGQLTEVQGYENVSALIGDLGASLPEATRQSLRQAFNTESLAAEVQRDHTERIETYLGREIRVGDLVASTIPTTLPNGDTIVYHNIIHFAATEPCGQDRTCIEIAQFFDSDPTGLPEAAQELIEAIPPEERTANAKSGISGEIHRLIDPETMLIYAETSSRVMRMTIEVPGQGATNLTTRENRHYTYTYPADTSAPSSANDASAER